MTYDYGYEALKLADKANVLFNVYYEDGSDGEVAYYGNNASLGWDVATHCDEGMITFEDGSFIHLVHGNGPDETISDHSISGTADFICNLVFAGVRA